LLHDHSLIFKATFEISAYPTPSFGAEGVANRTKGCFDSRLGLMRALLHATDERNGAIICSQA